MIAHAPTDGIPEAVTRDVQRLTFAGEKALESSHPAHIKSRLAYLADLHLATRYDLSPAITRHAVKRFAGSAILLIRTLCCGAETNTYQHRVRTLRMFLQRVDVAACAEEPTVTHVRYRIALTRLTAGVTQLESRVVPLRQTHVNRHLIVLNQPTADRRHYNRTRDIQLNRRPVVYLLLRLARLGTRRGNCVRAYRYRVHIRHQHRVLRVHRDAQQQTEYYVT